VQLSRRACRRSYLTTVPAGSRLVAEAREIKQGKRAGFYQVDVMSKQGVLVAQVQGIAHRAVLPD